MTLKQTMIALDQVGNTLIADYPGGPRGWADETISSRSWRLSQPGALPGREDARLVWERRRRRIDWVALKLFGDENHCASSYVNELLRAHEPPEIRLSPATEQTVCACSNL